MYQCPNDPEHTEFETTIREAHTWVMDAGGEFVKDLGCDFADGKVGDNLVICRKCGAECEDEDEIEEE